MSGFERPIFEPGLAARAFSAFDSPDGHTTFAFPLDRDEWFVYFLGVGTLPTWMVTFGLVGGCFAALNLARPAPAPKTEQSRPLLTFGLLLLVTSWLSAALAFREARDAATLSVSAWDDGVRSVNSADHDILALNITSAQLHKDLGQNLLQSCNGLEQLIQRSLGGDALRASQQLQTAADDDFLGMRVALEQLKSSLAVFEGLLEGASVTFSDIPSFLEYSFLLPIKLLMACLLAFAAVCAMHAIGGSFEEAVETVGIGRLAAAFTFLVIVSLVLSASSAFGMGERLGDYCVAPDAAMLGITKDAGSLLGNERTATDLAKFYIAGVGQSPVLQSLGQVKSHAASVISILSDNKDLLQELVLFCPDIRIDPWSSSLVGLRMAADRNLNLLGEGVMFSHYNQAVHIALCGSFMSSLSILVLLQFSLGFICVPLASAFARPWIGQGAGREPAQVAASPRPGQGQGRWMLESEARRRQEQGPPEGARLLDGDNQRGRDSSRSIQAVNALLQSKADMSHVNVGGQSLLETATTIGDVEFLRRASQQGTEVSNWDYARAYGNSFLGSLTGSSQTLALAVSKPAFAAELEQANAAANSKHTGNGANPAALANFVPKRKGEVDQQQTVKLGTSDAGPSAE